MERPNGSWRVTRVSATGTSHGARGLPCQDASAHELSGSACVVAVADGVGSAARSEDGARVAVDAVVSFLGPRVAELVTEEQWAECLRKAASHALAAVKAAAAAEGQEARALASTLLIVAANDDTVAAFQIGDGAIVASFGDEGLAALTVPKKGEFANEVLPLTSKGALESAQIKVVRKRATALAAFTDGLESLALKLAEGIPHEGFFAPIFALGAKVDEEQLATEIRALFDERVKKRSDDDLTLAIAVRPRPRESERATAVPEVADEAPPIVTELASAPSTRGREVKVVPQRSGSPSFPAPEGAALVIATAETSARHAARKLAEPRGPSSPPPLRARSVYVILGLFPGVLLGYWAGSLRVDFPAVPISPSSAPTLAGSCPIAETVFVELAGARTGQACDPEEPCQEWLSCVEGRCLQKGYIGQPCAVDDECQEGLECKSSSCVGPKSPKKPSPKSCAGLWLRGACRFGRLQAGQRCDEDDDCAKPMLCLDQICQPGHVR